METGVRTGEVDVLEDALGAGLGVERLGGGDAVVRDANNLAGAHVSHVLGAHDVEGARLAGNDPSLVIRELAQAQRADAVGVAEGVERVLADEGHGVAALHHGHRVGDACAQLVLLLGKEADEAGCHLGVRVRAERHAVVDELHAQLVEVHERAVVGKGDEHVVDGREVRLGALPALGPGRAIAHVADGDLAGKGREVRVSEGLGHEAKILRGHDGGAISHGDARALLAAVLQRMEGEVRHARDVSLRGPDSEHSTLVMKRVRVVGGILVHRTVRHAVPLR